MTAARRVDPSMSPFDALTAMAEGNPGAIKALMALLNYHKLQDDEAVAWIRIFQLDEMRIYGPAIWILYDDYCKRSLDVLDTVINNNDEAVVDFLNAHRGRGPGAEPVQRRIETANQLD